MKAFIFDMDGVIVDSELLHSKMKRQTLADFGLRAEGFDLTHYMGRPSKDFFRDVLAAEPRPELTAKELAEHKHRLYLERLGSDEALQAIDGIAELLAALRAAGVKIGLASSSGRNVIEIILGRFGLRDYFDVIMSGQELPASKPDPAVYLLTAEALGVSPADCMVLEDASAGVTAAKRAGMYCIGYRNPHSGEQDFSAADRVVASVREIAIAEYFG